MRKAHFLFAIAPLLFIASCMETPSREAFICEEKGRILTDREFEDAAIRILLEEIEKTVNLETNGKSKTEVFVETYEENMSLGYVSVADFREHNPDCCGFNFDKYYDSLQDAPGLTRNFLEHSGEYRSRRAGNKPNQIVRLHFNYKLMRGEEHPIWDVDYYITHCGERSDYLKRGQRPEIGSSLGSRNGFSE